MIVLSCKNRRSGPGTRLWPFSMEAGLVPYRKVGALEACWYMLRWKLKEVFRMPRFPDHPCRHPGCSRLVPKGRKYCDEHAGLHPEDTRSAAARGYGSKWQRQSKQFLRVHPLCVVCEREGKYVLATVVDHIRPHRGDAQRGPVSRISLLNPAGRGGPNLYKTKAKRPRPTLAQKKAGSNRVLTQGPRKGR